MAAGIIEVADTFKLRQWTGATPVPLTGANMKLMLVTALPTAATVEYISEVTEATNTGSIYTGPIGVSLTVVNDAGIVRVKTTDLVIAQDATGFANAQAWVIFEDTAGGAATDPIVCFGDFGSAKGNITGSLTIDFENTNNGTLFEY